MPITLKNPTFTRKANEDKTVEVFFNSTEPGTVTAAAPGCTFPDGAEIEIEGTRVWRMNNRAGDGHCYGPGPETAQRNPCTIYCTVPFNKIQTINAYARYNYALQIARNYDKTSGVYTNWFISTYRPNGNSNYLTLTFIISQTKTSAPTTISLNVSLGLLTLSKILRIVVTINGTSLKINTSIDGAAPVETSGTLAWTIADVCDNSTLLIADGSEFAHWSSVITGTDFTNLVRYGTIPAGANCVYLANEESGNTLFDTSGNLRDSTLNADAAYPSTGISRDFTDDPGDPVVPASSIRVTIPAGVASPVTLTLSRPRQGVPSRATDEERFETTTGTITLTTEAETITIGPDVTCQVLGYPQSFDLMIASNYDGSCAVVSNNAALVPTSPVTISNGVAVCACTVTADVTAATVTATGPGGDTDTCEVTVSEVPETIIPVKIGPSQTVRRGSTSLVLHLSGAEGAVTLASTPAGLEVPASATISSGEATVTIPIMSAGTYTITATQGALSDTAVVTVPAIYVASDDYDLTRDAADVVEAFRPSTGGNNYHYDEELFGVEDKSDCEDRVFSIRIDGVQEGPVIGGKTVSLMIGVVAEPEARPADIQAMQDYLTQDAEWPSYVGACVCNVAAVARDGGADMIIYQAEIILG